MTDYIKREDAIKAMARGIGIPYTDFIEVAERCMDDIQNADVVEVVRCKDCKWWDNDDDAERCTHKYGGMWAKSDGYCSYGERAEA